MVWGQPWTQDQPCQSSRGWDPSSHKIYRTQSALPNSVENFQKDQLEKANQKLHVMTTLLDGVMTTLDTRPALSEQQRVGWLERTCRKRKETLGKIEKKEVLSLEKKDEEFFFIKLFLFSFLVMLLINNQRSFHLINKVRFRFTY